MEIEKIYKELQQRIDESKVNDNLLHICRENAIKFLRSVTEAMFFEYYGDICESSSLKEALEKSYKYLNKTFKDKNKDYKKEIDSFFIKIPELRDKLMLDAKAIYEGDPASNSLEDIITTYPGFIAISTYRIAHEFYLMGLTSFARVLSEHVHSKTGIDINPGATIGKSFFIDHGTGIVIGETALIGDNCKIYQGVTLGALSLREGRKLKTTKRHPTLLNNVTIYSGSSIFGGDTIIGNHVTIGANVEIRSSISDNTVVTTQPNNIHIEK